MEMFSKRTKFVYMHGDQSVSLTIGMVQLKLMVIRSFLKEYGF